MGHGTVAHRSTVDEQVLLIELRARVLRRRDHTPQAHGTGAARHRQRRLREALAQDLAQPCSPGRLVGCRRVAADHAAVVTDREGDIEVHEREGPHDVQDPVELRALGAQEPAPGRYAREQVAHLDGGTRRVRARPRLGVAAVEHPAVALLGPGTVTAETQLTDGRDARECLAAKAHRRDGFQIVQAADLAGGVSRESERQLIPVDADSVVAHADAAHAALLEEQFDSPRARVEGVVEQFLDHRRGSLDDLAGRDLIDQELGQGRDPPPAVRRPAPGPVTRAHLEGVRPSVFSLHPPHRLPECSAAGRPGSRLRPAGSRAGCRPRTRGSAKR